MHRLRPSLLVLALAAAGPASSASAQWDPNSAQWGKSDPTHVRVMTWNIKDGICSTNFKTEGMNNWSALARIVAALEPDVLILQECGDNTGNGTGSGVDSPFNLTTTLDLFVHGGTDPFRGGAVTAYVQKYASAGYDLPFVYVSSTTDNFNRNAVLSAFPFADLNGDGNSQYPDIPAVSADAYAPGGNGGIRGFMFVELDLPDGTYPGDLVVGNVHLKAGSGGSNQSQRENAARNTAYFIDYFYNGAGTGTPDPNGKIADNPPATSILGPATPVVAGGDFNEDENLNGRKGPAEWLVNAQTGGGADGTDRDRSDSTFDAATHFFTGSRTTASSDKFDYLLWQDSIATEVRSVVFNSIGTPVTSLPTALAGWGTASNWASDHKTVFVDLDLGGGGPGTLTMLAPTPGLAGVDNSFQVINAPAGDNVKFYYGKKAGSTPVTGCPGLFFDLKNATLFGAAAANGAGVAEIQVFVPNRARNRTIHLQAVDADACVLTPKITQLFL